MREAEAAAPPPKRLRLSIKRHRSSLPPPIPKDPADIPATSAIDHLSDGSSRRKSLAASSQHGPSSSPSTARGEPVDNAGDVYRTADKSVAASPLSSDGFAAGSLAAEEICLLRRCSSSASDSGPSEVAAAGTVPSSEAEGKKEKDENFLVQCSQRLPSEPEAAEVPTHDAVVALEEEGEEARENLNFVLEQEPLDGIPSTLTTFHDLLNEMEAQELLEHEPNAPSDAEQLDDVNNIAAMDPVTIPEDPVVIPEAMNNEPMVQSNTAAWALTTLVQEQQLRAPEVVEISDEERVDNGTAGVNTDIDDLGGGNGSGQLDDDDFHVSSTNADFAAFAIPAGSFKDVDSKPDQVSTQRPGDGEADVVTCPICMEAWTSIGSHRICSLACGHLFGKSCIKRWLRQAGKKQGKCPQCNCRARVEDLRTLYVPRIAVIDGEGQQIMQISELMEEIHRSQALLSVLCPEQHDALNAFQWTQCQRTPESLRTLHQPIHPRIIPVPPLHQVAQENHRQFPTNIGQADLKNCRKYQSHKLQTQFAQHSSCHYTGGSGIHNQASPELRVLQERNIWGQSYALESSRISECAGIWEPRQGKRDSTQARPLRTFSSLASIGSRGLKSTFVLQDEVPLQGAKVFDVNAHSQLLLVSHKPADCGASSGLMKMSLMALSEGECIDVPSGTSVIRDIRIAPSGTRAPGRLALVASLGKKLTVFSLESNNVVITYALQSPSWSCAWDPCDPNQVYSGLQNGSLLVFDMRQTGAPIATLKGPSCNPIHTLQHVPEHSRLAEQGESVKESSGLLSASCSSLCFWSDIGSSNLQTDGYRPMCLSQPAESSVCVSLAYNAVIDMAVASFRPKPTQFVDVEARSTSSPSPTLSSPAEVPSQPTDSLGLPEDMGLLPSHISYSRKPKSPFPGEDKDRSTVLHEPSFFWEQQGRMVGHKSQRVMSRSAIVSEWQPDQASGSRTNPETGSLYAFGDEGSNSVWLWDLVSRAKTQSLIPHHSPVLDIRSVHTAGADILGCISERTLQVYRRLPP